MENQNLELKKYILQYGALLGGISVVFGLMLFSLEMHYQNETSTTLVSIAITIGVIAFAQYSYRKDNEGFMSFSQGIKMGLGMAAISGLINVAYFLVLSNVLDPEMMNKALQMGMDQFLEQNPEASQDMINQVESMQEKFSGPIMTSSFIIVLNLFSGLIISVITGLIFSKSRPE
jgi:Zn-dependent alcohol dehydrogenase